MPLARADKERSVGLCCAALLVAGIAGCAPVPRIVLAPDRCAGPEPEQIEYDVYSHVLGEVAQYRQISIHPSTGKAEAWVDALGTGSETMRDFARKVGSNACLKRAPNAMPAPGEREPVELWFSRVGFDDARTIAAVSVAIYRGEAPVRRELFVVDLQGRSMRTVRSFPMDW